jgi:hypothetical protein
MKKIIKTGACLAVIPALLLAGCSQDTSSDNAKPIEESNSKEEHYTKENLANSPRFASEANYQAIEPSEDAQPLKTNYTDKQLAEMPRTSAWRRSNKKHSFGSDIAKGSGGSNGWSAEGKSNCFLLW